MDRPRRRQAQRHDKAPDYRVFMPSPERFAALFGVGGDPTRIHPVDACGVILSALQGLHEAVRAQQAEIEQLRRAMARCQPRCSARPS